MDYELLLRKYIGHVIQCEGVSFIPDDENDRVRFAPLVFAKEEVEELQRLERSIERD